MYIFVTVKSLLEPASKLKIYQSPMDSWPKTNIKYPQTIKTETKSQTQIEPEKAFLRSEICKSKYDNEGGREVITYWNLMESSFSELQEPDCASAGLDLRSLGLDLLRIGLEMNGSDLEIAGIS